MSDEIEACKSCPMAKAGSPEQICQLCRTFGGTSEGKALANLMNGEYLRTLIENTPIEEIDHKTGQVVPVYLSDLLKNQASNPFEQPALRTQEVIDHYFKFKQNEGVKEATISTYSKRLALFAREFPVLPLKADTILKYLARFSGETGRHRRNHQDTIKGLYEHAEIYFELPRNPMAKMRRPRITHKAIATLKREQVRQFVRIRPQQTGDHGIDLGIGGSRGLFVRPWHLDIPIDKTGSEILPEFQQQGGLRREQRPATR